MSTAQLDNSNVSKVLGKTVDYPDQYDSSILVREPRHGNRKHLDLDDNNLPFCGYDIWNAYEVYVRCKIIEDETGSELWDWKISSKLVIYSSLCYKTIIRDGKKISVYSFDDIMERRLKEIFKIIDDQIKDKNYLNN